MGLYKYVLLHLAFATLVGHPGFAQECPEQLDFLGSKSTEIDSKIRPGTKILRYEISKRIKIKRHVSISVDLPPPFDAIDEFLINGELYHAILFAQGMILLKDGGVVEDHQLINPNFEPNSVLETKAVGIGLYELGNQHSESSRGRIHLDLVIP